MYAYVYVIVFCFLHFIGSRIPIISLEAAIVVREHFSCAINVRQFFALTSLCANVLRRNRSSVREQSSNIIAQERPSNILSFIEDNNTVWRHHHLYISGAGHTQRLNSWYVFSLL